MRLRSKQRRYYLSIFHPNHSVDIIRYSQTHNRSVYRKRSTLAPEIITVRKNNVASPNSRFTPGPLQILRWSGLPWQYFYFTFST